VKFGVVVFPGSNCDRDVAYVTRDLLNQPTRMVWHEETDISDLDVVVIPGGFSYGDYLRGAIARFSPVMRRVVEHAQQGKFVLGICNGFQVLTEAGLLPGVLVRNRDLHLFAIASLLKWSDLSLTQAYSPEQIITLAIAHGEGQYYVDFDILTQLEDNGRSVMKETISSSVNNIAGICNRQGNVLGMMPHPERASDPMLGGTDGMKLFQGLLATVRLAKAV